MMGHSYETCKLLVEYGLDITAAIEHFGDMLQCAVEDDNLDWVRFCLESYADPTLNLAYNEHLFLANATTFCLQ